MVGFASCFVLVLLGWVLSLVIWCFGAPSFPPFAQTCLFGFSSFVRIVNCVFIYSDIFFYSCVSPCLLHSAWFGGLCMMFFSYPVRSHGTCVVCLISLHRVYVAMYQYISSPRSLSQVVTTERVPMYWYSTWDKYD